MNIERMLVAVRALRESALPEGFDMKVVIHACGRPGCAFGHYVARTDLQSEFEPIPDLGMCVRHIPTDSNVSYDNVVVREHFDFADDDELDQFFGAYGCNNARTPAQAADYIERFIAQQACHL